jgi:hypothetical protein
VFHDLTKHQNGRARDVVILALAERGDKTVHDEITKLAQDSDAGLFRAWAVNELRTIGAADDLPMLRTLAATDPLVRDGGLPPPHPTDSRGPTFPVRDAARDAIRVIEKQ